MRFSARCCTLFVCCALLASLGACAGRSDRKTPDADHAAAETQPDPAHKQTRGDGRDVYPDRLPPQNSPSPLPLNAAPIAEDAGDLDDYSGPTALPIADPLESWNRFWFSFNDVVYARLLRPLHNAYTLVTPDFLRAGLKNALTNALFPVRFINSILQGRFKAAGVEFGRFIVNSTLGAGGLMDVTKDRKTIVETDPDGADFGQTLGVWGTGPGVYLIWPILGPSNIRDTIGRAADWAMDPLLFVPGTTTLNMTTAGIWGGLRFNAADDALTTYENINKTAVDPYLAVRDVYVRYRQGRVDKRYADYSGTWNKPAPE